MCIFAEIVMFMFTIWCVICFLHRVNSRIDRVMKRKWEEHSSDHLSTRHVRKDFREIWFRTQSDEHSLIHLLDVCICLYLYKLIGHKRLYNTCHTATTLFYGGSAQNDEYHNKYCSFRCQRRACLHSILFAIFNLFDILDWIKGRQCRMLCAKPSRGLIWVRCDPKTIEKFWKILSVLWLN